MTQPPAPQRIVIVGAGFGGVYTALRLERLVEKARLKTGGRVPLEIILISSDNYFLITPLLFEAGSGVLEPRHAVSPLRPLLHRARFVEGDVEGIDLQRRVLLARNLPEGAPFELPYDQLVLAVGGITNRGIIPGSEHALAFKTLADAIYLRNRMIDLFERADVEADPQRQLALLTIVIVGAGLVGIELAGEFSTFMDSLRRFYPRVRRVRMVVLEHGPRILGEMEEPLADYAHRTLCRRGIEILTNTPASRIEPGRIHLADGRTIDAGTIILATGVAANPLLAMLPLQKDRKGRIVVEPTMRVAGHDNIWALGDCAAIPDPQGKPYPSLAQHALREARTLGTNLWRTVAGQGSLQPFVYQTLGTLAALGGHRGVGRVMRFHLRGFIAWWVWRTYYLLQMPRWDRRIRIMLDWTVELLFKNDVVKLELFGREHPHSPRPPALPAPSAPPAPATAPASAPPTA